MASTSTIPPTPERGHSPFLAGGMAIVVAISIAKFIFHFYFNNWYGYFRD